MGGAEGEIWWFVWKGGEVFYFCGMIVHKI
jgi:hypothetical protein